MSAAFQRGVVYLCTEKLNSYNTTVSCFAARVIPV